MAVKVKLKYQLCGLVSLTALTAVGILTLVTWFYTYGLVFELRAARLEVIASLKAKELSQALLVFTVGARALSSRGNIANALLVPENHENFTRNWTNAQMGFSTLLGTYPEVAYIAVWNRTLDRSYLNLTTVGGWDFLSTSTMSPVPVLDALDNVAAYSCPGGPPADIKAIVAGEAAQGLPKIEPQDITSDGLFLGPVIANGAYFASITMPVYNNTTVATAERSVLGFMTVVFNLRTLVSVANDTQGLGETGQVLVIGPDMRFNKWDNSTGKFGFDAARDRYKYLLPPKSEPQKFLAKERVDLSEVAMKVWESVDEKNGVNMNTRDASGKSIAIGYATVPYWPTSASLILLVEQERGEAFAPMYTLRRIVVGCVFGMFGIILLLTLPMAHFATRPVGQLYEATKLSGRPPEYREEPKKHWWSHWPFGAAARKRSSGGGQDAESQISTDSSGRREQFRIPQKVLVGKHFIEDELTQLSHTFNSMTDELLTQYENLEAKVQLRTEELEQQKTLAESANEAKTMFIANVSHELRTPLNGILGMCSLVLEENNLPARTRENLEVVFKSGELLSHLLNDLLTFSKNQVWGAQVKLESAPFRVREFTQQIMALFGTQAREKGIDLTCEVTPEDGMDYCFTGDVNRILQVVINLINNSLKFTPEQGSVQLMIVMEPNPESTNITPYTDASDTLDYITSATFHSNETATTTPPPLSIQPMSPPPKSTSPLPHPPRPPTRPALFSRRHSHTTGIVNPESDHTKNLPSRFKKFLNPANTPARSRAPSPISDSSMPYMVEFRVSDTGPGVPENMQSKIFEPFVQGDAGLSRKYGGTGLGLSICQQLSRLMGGDIQLKSFEGAGSTFTLRIPLQTTSASAISSIVRGGDISHRSAHTTARSLSIMSPSDAHSDPTAAGNMRLVGMSQPFFVPGRRGSDASSLSSSNPNRPAHPPKAPTTETTPTVRPTIQPPTPPPPQDPIHVLIAEDNKVNQKVLIRLLALENITSVTLAEDGLEALTYFPSTRLPDIVFMDIQMPNMDGHEATAEIRKRGYQGPIVALTAFADESNVKRCFESGMDCFLAKPVRRQQIRQMLRLYVAGKCKAEEVGAE